jgi:hypothetical protein
MPFQLTPFQTSGGPALTEPILAALLDDHAKHTLPRLELLWQYYRNPLTLNPPGATRPYRLGQERGLAQRLAVTPPRAITIDDRRPAGRDLVVENDIAWRIHAMVDFLFARPVRIVSTAANPALRATIEAALEACLEKSGGASMLADAALLGHVYGHVDLLVRAGPTLARAPEPDPEDQGAPGSDPSTAPPSTPSPDLLRAARDVHIEPIDPTRAVPLVSRDDYRRLDAFILRFKRPGFNPETGAPRPVTITRIYAPNHRQFYEDRGQGPRLTDRDDNPLTPGEVPVAHIQNISQPFAYAGLSEVEPLIPLQDELNTRLCDRAYRVTMQSFKMYLAKGLDTIGNHPIGPGTVFATDNPDASIAAFGGDADSPSEDRHLEDLREALDKQSSLPPLATGVVRARIGNLSSENALRLTLQGVLSRTARKRLSYGRGIAEACRLALTILHNAGALLTRPEDRAVNIEWPDTIPRTLADEIETARAKVELGQPRDRALADLGLGIGDPGVV